MSFKSEQLTVARKSPRHSSEPMTCGSGCRCPSRRTIPSPNKAVSHTLRRGYKSESNGLTGDSLGDSRRLRRNEGARERRGYIIRSPQTVVAVFELENRRVDRGALERATL